MNENQIADIWMLFKDFFDKKLHEAAAERYVELLADHGISDRTFGEALGYDDVLDSAIEYYLGADAMDDDAEDNFDEDNWDFDNDE